MGFKSSRTEGGSSEGTSDVDWDALNKHVFETCKLEQPETLVGYISMIVELGKQEQEPGSMKSELDAEGEAAYLAEELEKHGKKDGFEPTEFKEVKDKQTQQMVHSKVWKVKPVHCVALAIDFPEIMLNKGKFFGDKDAKEMPLRLWIGGKYKNKMGYKTNLRESKRDFKVWSLGKGNPLHKMAVAAKLVGVDEPFGVGRLEELLGKSLQFKCRVYMNGEYLNDKITFAGGLGRGQDELELKSETHCVYFDQASAEGAWKGVSNHVKNTIRESIEYEHSFAQMTLDKSELAAPTEDKADEEEEMPF